MNVRRLMILGAVLLFALPAMAQDNQKVDVAVDFSYIRWNPSKNYSNSVNLYGGGGSIAYFFTDHIGIKGEFNGYGSQNFRITIPTGDGNQVFVANGNMFTYLFGPIIQKRSGGIRPFGQVLLGGAHTNVYSNLHTESGNFSPTGNAFAMAVGGGLDIRLGSNPHVSIRPAEVDYFLTHFNAFSSTSGINNNNQNNFRFQAGIVFSF
jgi:opacity protein-like surface antigen